MITNKESLKQYNALLNQTSTNAPVATELYNTLGTIEWSRLTNGTYRGTLTGETMPADSTSVISGNTLSGSNQLAVSCTRATTTAIDITVFIAEVPTDSALLNFPIEIKVYNKYQ